MAGLKLNHLYKVYPNGLKAVNDFTMDIEDREFIVFVGPSGCGKSTTLRMIAGLEEITAGELYIDGTFVNQTEPKDRDIAMVFQNYALYPHMTVYDNIAFGLKIRKLSKPEIDAKVHEAAAILGLTDYLQKKPKEMSGGQRQRVALGRAIVRNSKVFLLDEPLSNLDAKLRTSMRSEIAKLHQKLQTTFIYVTHDQVEAMTMGTRIVVMKDGYIQQIDTPRNLYNYPVNKFVAGFIGTPQMNFYAAKLQTQENCVRLTLDKTTVDLAVPYETLLKTDKKYFYGKPIVMGIRCENISVNAQEYPFRGKCRVSYVEELGAESQVYADFNLDSAETVTESDTRVIIKAPAGTNFTRGEIIEVSFDLSHAHFFDAETELAVKTRIPEQMRFTAEIKNGALMMLGASIPLPSAIPLGDGFYDAVCPTDAFSFGGDIAAEYVSEEAVENITLVRVKAGNDTVFMKKTDRDGFDGKISLDLKRCSFECNGEQVVSALQTENLLEAKIVPVKKNKHARMQIVAAGVGFDCSDDMLQRILGACGKSVVKEQLELRFSPYTVHVAESGIPAMVENIVDYGDVRFVVCRVGDRKITVRLEGELSQKEIYLDLNLSEIAVWNRTHDMRLV